MLVRKVCTQLAKRLLALAVRPGNTVQIRQPTKAPTVLLDTSRLETRPLARCAHVAIIVRRRPRTVVFVVQTELIHWEPWTNASFAQKVSTVLGQMQNLFPVHLATTVWLVRSSALPAKPAITALGRKDLTRSSAHLVSTALMPRPSVRRARQDTCAKWAQLPPLRQTACARKAIIVQMERWESV